MSQPFPPTLAAAQQRLAAVLPADYARTRQAITGAVSRLSPYLTHGMLDLPAVWDSATAQQALPPQHKFRFELGWRAYFRHVWSHRGDGILQSLHAGPLPDEAYARTVPADVRLGATGVPVVDQAVRTLYDTGWLHNHARLWLASYLVHVRKVHWRTGADWLQTLLLDGDLASNHLSWQWVAGTGSHQPYLFNAENVARHAPAAWHSPGSVLDTNYEALSQRARSTDPPAPTRPAVPTIPLRHDTRATAAVLTEPTVLATPPAEQGLQAPDAAAVAGRDVWLVHPWNLGPLPTDLPPGTLVLGLAVAEFHQAWPWRRARWQFVGRRMAELAPLRWHGSATAIGQALAQARSVQTVAEPHLAAWLPQWARCRPAPALFPAVAQRCDSFSKWWSKVQPDRRATMAEQA